MMGGWLTAKAQFRVLLVLRLGTMDRLAGWPTGQAEGNEEEQPTPWLANVDGREQFSAD